jgi:phospholipid/cholesterol/gamma-HCH transport system substrate-binding protein
MNRTRAAVVGAFLVGGVLLFAVGLFLIGDRRLLFARQFEIYAEFGKVTGLQVGSGVRLAGLNAGEVVDIAIPSRPSERFRVRLRLREDVHQLVRTDSVAAVQTDGIVGNAFVQVSRGTDGAAVVPRDATITGVDPVELADLIQEGRETFRTVTQQIVDLKGEFSEALGAVTTTVQSGNELIAEVQGDLTTMMRSGTRTLDDVHGVLATTQSMIDDVKAGHGTVGQLLTDDTLYRRATGLATEAEVTMRTVRATAERGRTFMEEFTGPTGPAQQTARALREIIAQGEEVVSDMSEASEALKHNFLFRGFFRERGFYDLDALSQAAYRAGALEGTDRTALRIWLDASLLFARNSDGAEQLTDEGKRRLESAMADFVRYPRNSPIVVEGYAQSAAGEAAYLASADRASLVRDYLGLRFRRKATLLGFIGLSELAPDSPRGDGRWSGIALTIFVRKDALAQAPAAHQP